MLRYRTRGGRRSGRLPTCCAPAQLWKLSVQARPVNGALCKPAEAVRVELHFAGCERLRACRGLAGVKAFRKNEPPVLHGGKVVAPSGVNQRKRQAAVGGHHQKRKN